MIRFLVILLMITCGSSTSGQTYWKLEPGIKQEAELLLQSFDHHSALELLDTYAKSNERIEEVVTDLEFRMLRAEALERLDLDTSAIVELTNISEMASANSMWHVYSQAQLTLARLHEKRQQKIPCKQSLDLCWLALQSNPNDHSAYARYYLSLASYYRQLEHNNTEALQYAYKCIHISDSLDFKSYLANGHMLVGHLISPSNLEKKAQHLRRAAQGFRDLNDHYSLSITLHALANTHRDVNTDSVDYFVDSLKTILLDTNKVGANFYYASHLYYRWLSQKYNQKDSIEKYDQLSNYMIDLYHQNRKQQAITNLTYFYQQELYDKKSKLIKSNLASNYRLNNLFILLLLIAAIMLSFLFWEYKTMQKIKKQVAIQNILIANTNELKSIAIVENKSLVREVHHRVKNNLQQMLGLIKLHQSKANAKGNASLKALLLNRLRTTQAVHQWIQTNEVKPITIGKYFDDCSKAIQKTLGELGECSTFIENPNQLLSISDIMPLSVIIAELFNNSIKHANQNPLLITLVSDSDSTHHIVKYRDNGLGFQNIGKLEEGIGLKLVNGFTRQLKGNITFTNENGAFIVLMFPVKV